MLDDLCTLAGFRWTGHKRTVGPITVLVVGACYWGNIRFMVPTAYNNESVDLLILPKAEGLCETYSALRMMRFAVIALESNGQMGCNRHLYSTCFISSKLLSRFAPSVSPVLPRHRRGGQRGRCDRGEERVEGNRSPVARRGRRFGGIP